MASADKPEDAERDDKQAGADLDLALPFHEGDMDDRLSKCYAQPRVHLE